MRVRVVLGVLLALALVAGAAWWILRDRRTTYEEALATLPAQTLRASYTDWAFAKDTVDAQKLPAFIDQAYDADITRGSALENTAVEIDEVYGISLRDALWETYGQSDDGSVAVLRVADSTSYSRLRDVLRRAGYDEPRSETAAWAGSAEVISGLNPSLSPVMQNVLLLEDDHLVLFSDSAAYAEDTADVIDGSRDSLLDSVSDLAAVADRPVAAILWAQDFACGALSMSEADASDQALADALVRGVGGVDPLDGLVMARSGSGDVTVGMQFANDDQATANLQARTDLASGEAPGLGGSFRDRFTLGSAKTDDRLVVLQLRPAPDEHTLLSSISSGPVVFATC